MHPSSTRSTRASLLAFLAACGTLLPTHHVRAAAPVVVHAEAFAAPIPVDVPDPLPTRRPLLDAQVVKNAFSQSGQAMPVGDLPGWTQTTAMDFTGQQLPAGWSAYTGVPGGSRNGWWSPSQVDVSGGELRLHGSWVDGIFTTGGVMAWGARQTYGKYEVRFRAPKAHGVKYALLLWPSHGGWPATGEIDFAEDGDGARRGTAATLHHGADNRQVQRSVRADFSQWQTVGVEWTPGHLVYTLNGAPWGEVDSDAVPSGPMDLALQLEAGAGDRWSAVPDKTTPVHVTPEVDWAVGYRRP